MNITSIGIALVLAGFASADTITLRTGGQIQGTFLGGSSREVKIEVGDQVQAVDVENISGIEFSRPAAEPARPIYFGRMSVRHRCNLRPRNCLRERILLSG